LAIAVNWKTIKRGLENMAFTQLPLPYDFNALESYGMKA
jgi:hypothetical protein